MNKQTLLQILLIASISFSCNNTEKPSGITTIDVASAMTNICKLNASDCFGDIRYVALETNDSSLVGRNPSVQIAGDKIVITSMQRQCLLFDKQSGKFIRTIGHIGNDPEGYSNSTCWVDEQSGLLYFPGHGDYLVCYRTDGTFAGRIPLPVASDGFSMMNYYYLKGDTLLAFCHNVLGQEKRRLIFFTKDGKTIEELPNNQSASSFEIDRIDMFNNDYASSAYTPVGAKGVSLLASKDGESASVTFMGNSNFWYSGQTVYFKEAYNDTIFRIEGTQLIPDKVFDLGAYHWPYEERFDKKQDKNIFITQCLENQEVLLFRFITGLFNEDNRKLYNGVYNKRTGKVAISLLKDGLVDDLTRFLALQPLYASAEGEWAGLLPAEAIDKPIDSLKDIREDDNPVIVLMK